MSAGHSPSEHPNAGPLRPEPDNLPVGFLAGFIIAISAVMIFVAVVARQLLYTTVQHQIEAVDTSVAPRQLSELRWKEQAQLENYDAVDAEKGLYRIPIDLAIDAYVQKAGP